MELESQTKNEIQLEGPFIDPNLTIDIHLTLVEKVFSYFAHSINTFIITFPLSDWFQKLMFNPLLVSYIVGGCLSLYYYKDLVKSLDQIFQLTNKWSLLINSDFMHTEINKMFGIAGTTPNLVEIIKDLVAKQILPERPIEIRMVLSKYLSLIPDWRQKALFLMELSKYSGVNLEKEMTNKWSLLISTGFGDAKLNLRKNKSLSILNKAMLHNFIHEIKKLQTKLPNCYINLPDIPFNGQGYVLGRDSSNPNPRPFGYSRLLGHLGILDYLIKKNK